MIVSILHNIAQVPELTSELRRCQCVEVRLHDRNHACDVSSSFLQAFNQLIPTVGSNSTFLKGISYLTLAYIIREDERAYLSSSNGKPTHLQ